MNRSRIRYALPQIAPFRSGALNLRAVSEDIVCYKMDLYRGRVQQIEYGNPVFPSNLGSPN